MSLERIDARRTHVVPRLARITERALDKVGLTLPQYRVLAFLSLGPSAGVALAEWLTVSPPSVSALVDGLVTRGLVARERSRTDRRRVEHTLTAAGREALIDADGVVGERLDELLAVLSTKRRRAALDGLAAVAEAFDVQRARRLASS
ncbi:MAG: winged helix-turn-helix transcriptional regulator [Euzebyales bacterium]|nr:winged helix-turn-helix transcriptional regulator [Euzebyales bacterium]